MNDNEMPAKGESVQTYVPLEIKKKLEDWAQEEERSISFLVAKLITEAVEAREAQHKTPAPEPSTGGRGGRGKSKDG
jgi:hypothetical protein